MNAGGRMPPFGPALTAMPDTRIYTKRKMLPATWQRTNPANPANERGGTGTPPSAPPWRKCSKPAPPDAFNTEDVPGDMAADESYESGE